MNSLTEGDKAVLREIAREMADEVIKSHVDSCPWRYELKISTLRLMLLMTASGTMGGFVSAALRLLG